MTSSPTVGAVLVNHNSGGTVLRTLQSLQAQVQPLAAIVVVDNASNDGLPGQIRAQHPGVQLIELQENVGLSRARNIGWRELATELVLFIDDDVYLEGSALQFMTQALERSDASVICPRIALYPAKETVQCDGAQIHFTGTLSLRAASDSRTAFVTTGFIGACVLVRREVLLAQAGFDEDYFFYFEDLELSYRLDAAGHLILCEPNAVAYHERGAGTEQLSFRGSGGYPSRRAYYVLRNRWLTILMHYQLRTLSLLAPALALYEFASAAECLRRGWLGQYLKACAWIIRNSTSILKRRRRWQSQRRRRDGEILSGGPLPFAAGFVQGRLQTQAVRALGRVLDSYWKAVQPWL